MKEYSKSILVVAFAVLPLVLSIKTAYATFPDVPADHIYADAINYVQEEGIVSGYSDGEFKAENTITRAEFTKIIINAKYNEEEINGCQTKYGYAYSSDINTKNIFPDVEALGKFSSYICMAKENGVVNGYGDGNYYPDRPITVGEASKIISNSYGLTDIQNPTNPDKFKPFVDALSARKAIPVTIYHIKDELTRGQMVEIIWRIDKKIENLETTNYELLNKNKLSLTGICDYRDHPPSEIYSACYLIDESREMELIESNALAYIDYGSIFENFKYYFGKRTEDFQYLIKESDESGYTYLSIIKYYYDTGDRVYVEVPESMSNGRTKYYNSFSPDPEITEYVMSTYYY